MQNSEKQKVSSSSSPIVSSRARILLSLLKTNPFRKLTMEDVNANPPPFSVFCGGTELYSFPASQSDATERVQENVRHFIGNYISVFVVLFLISLYKQPIPFLTLLASFPVNDYLDHLITKSGLDQAYPYIRSLIFFISKAVLIVLLMRAEVVIAFFLSLLAAYLGPAYEEKLANEPGPHMPMLMINEAFHTLYTGWLLATKEDIDSGMKQGTNHPMGPLELANLIV